MILVDLNQVMISNLMAQSKGNLTELPSKDAVRHSILNTIRAFNVKFKDEYGEMVLCADAADPWRRDIFPNYKHQRRVGRVESQIDWDGLFKIMSDIREEFINKLPFKVLHVDKCEADDIIGTLCAQQTEDLYLIISGDKDFIQLHRFTNVTQYSPITKKYVNGEDPYVYLKEHILKGDSSDGIPNVLSPDHTFVEGLRQKPLGKKKIQQWTGDVLVPVEMALPNDEVKRNFQRNEQLIDLSKSPSEIYMACLNAYKDAPEGDRSKLLNYFIEKRLTSLTENIGEF